MNWLLAAILSIGMVTMANAEVYELRTYTAQPGKLPNVVARFRDHTVRIFAKHGMKSIGYWIPQDDRKETTLIYILVHPSVEAAQKNWDAFRKDPEWIKAKEASEANGPIVLKTESVFLSPTDFSPLQ